MGISERVAYRAGMRDWIIQRASAVLMTIYFLFLLLWVLIHPVVTYASWNHLFACQWMKVATIVFFIALIFHAWVGIWTVITDYVKPFAVRLIVTFCVQIALVVYFIWALQIIWSV